MKKLLEIYGSNGQLEFKVDKDFTNEDALVVSIKFLTYLSSNIPNLTSEEFLNGVKKMVLNRLETKGGDVN